MEDIGARSLKEWLFNTQQQVKKDPTKVKYRILLFQLLCLLGDWERALTQLNVMAELDIAALPMVHTYRHALQCEGLRKRVFAGERSPIIFGEPEQWIALLVEALRLNTLGRDQEAALLRSEAFELAPPTPGAIEDPPAGHFKWIADADERLGPLLEGIVDGKYYWIPFQRIQTLNIEPPHDLRDLVWMPVFFKWQNGGETAGLIPTRYSGSEAMGDDRILKSALTDWVENASGILTGLGQRMFATDQGEYALMDLRRLKFEMAI